MSRSYAIRDHVTDAPYLYAQPSSRHAARTLPPSAMSSAQDNIPADALLPQRRQRRWEEAFEASIHSNAAQELAQDLLEYSRDVVLWSPRTQLNRLNLLNNYRRLVSADPALHQYVGDELNPDGLIRTCHVVRAYTHAYIFCTC